MGTLVFLVTAFIYSRYFWIFLPVKNSLIQMFVMPFFFFWHYCIEWWIRIRRVSYKWIFFCHLWLEETRVYNCNLFYTYKGYSSLRLWLCKHHGNGGFDLPSLWEQCSSMPLKLFLTYLKLWCFGHNFASLLYFNFSRTV